MKRTAFIACIAALAVAGTACSVQPAEKPDVAAKPDATASAKPAVSKSGIAELSRAEFEKLLEKPQKLLIVDVRRPDELTRFGGFPVFLSAQLKDLEGNLDWIPKDRTIVTVSNHAARSGRAADLLVSKGFKVVGTVGVQTFEEQGGKVTKFEVPPPRTTPASAATDAAAAPPAGTTN